MKADYMSSKQAICAYVASEALALLKQGIRINAICPGPTDTPLEQAYPLVFLCSAGASAITGQTIITDSGYFASGVTETFPDATPAVNFLLGRY